MAERARFAPSSAHIYGPGGCPGSVAMAAAQPMREATDESREGAAARWLLTQTLLALTVSDGAIAPNGVPINEEMREAIKEVVTDVADTIVRAKSGQDYYAVETRIGAPNLIHADFWGVPNVVFVQHSTKQLHIWEFAYGHRFVDVFENPTMLGYAACAIESEEIADPENWTFTFTIAQPRCFERDELGGTIREWFVPGTVVMPLIAKLQRAVHEADNPNAECRTGPYCRDCSASWDCMANLRMGGIAVDVALGQGSAGLTAEQVGLEARTLQGAMDRIKARLTGLDAKIQEMANLGLTVPFHKIEWSNPRQVWDPVRIPQAANLVAMFGVDVQPGVALPTPRECIKQGVDAAVIKPYVIKGNPAQKVKRVDETNAAKVLGSRS